MSGFIDIITTLGYVGIIAVIFAESGLLFGFIFPGDSLLFAVGLLASQGHFNIWILAVGCFLAAVAGDSFGYWFGRRLGPRIFTKEDSFFFHKRHIEKTAKFYERYGKKTVLLARVMPIVRTFAPIFAGVGKMPYKVFFFYNVMGGFIWTFGFLFLAYFLGSTVPAVSEYLKWIILGIVLTSFIPVLIEYRQDRK
ncbi:MAG TPA: VTT domain-containing protein [Candidatus Paceibacterota bacterium]